MRSVFPPRARTVLIPEFAIEPSSGTSRLEDRAAIKRDAVAEGGVGVLPHVAVGVRPEIGVERNLGEADYGSTDHA